jgi:hypothetical protein
MALLSFIIVLYVNNIYLNPYEITRFGFILLVYTHSSRLRLNVVHPALLKTRDPDVAQPKKRRAFL